MKNEKLHEVDANGIRFAYLESGSGELALLLHGFPDTAHTWDQFRPRLAEAGYRVVAPFLRGYPPSSAAPDGDYSPITLGRDVLELITALGHQRATVIGHDWGALCAHSAASQEPERITRMVTVAIPHPRATPPDLKLFRRAWHFLFFQVGGVSDWWTRRRDFAFIDYIYRWWSPGWETDPEEMRHIKDTLSAPGALDAVLGYYRSFMRAGIGAEGRRTREVMGRKTSVPTLAIAGDQDGALSLDSFERTPEAYTGPYEWCVLPGTGHFPHREHPAAFQRKVLEFVAG